MTSLAEIGAQLVTVIGASSAVGTAVWRYLTGRQKIADETTRALERALRDEGIQARAERDHERRERERERLEAAAMTAELGRRMDLIRDKAAADADAVVTALARLSTPAQMRDPSTWAEMPTKVRDRCELVATALAPAEEARLGRFARGERLTTPPGGTRTVRVPPPSLPSPPSPPRKRNIQR